MMMMMMETVHRQMVGASLNDYAQYDTNGCDHFRIYKYIEHTFSFFFFVPFFSLFTLSPFKFLYLFIHPSTVHAKGRMDGSSLLGTPPAPRITANGIPSALI